MNDFLNYVFNGILLGQLYALLALGFVVIYRQQGSSTSRRAN